MSATSAHLGEMKLPPARLLGLMVLVPADVAAAEQVRRMSAGTSSFRCSSDTSCPRSAREISSSRATRGLHAASPLPVTSVFLDSSVEHYLGSFKNPGRSVLWRHQIRVHIRMV